MEKNFLSPAEITTEFVQVGCKKVALRPCQTTVLAILAGAFIAFAAEGSNAAIHTITSVGLAKALAGALFATGLMLVVVAGGELFTGNCLIAISCADGKNPWRKLLANWALVYLGNFIGSLAIAVFIFYSGQFSFSNGLLGGFTIKTAVYKTGLSFGNAFFMGLLCNWLVCLAVWMAMGAQDIAGKLLAIFFPIWLFITSGFEHCVANMYYIPAGLLAKTDPAWVRAAEGLGVSAEKLANLTWVTLFTKNLIPVTLGNIVGGCLFVGLAYWITYRKCYIKEHYIKREENQNA